MAHLACDLDSTTRLLGGQPLMLSNGAANHHACRRTHAEGGEEDVVIGIRSSSIGDWLWCVANEEGGETGRIMTMPR